MQIKTDQHIIKGCIDNKREAQKALYEKYYKQFMQVSLRYTSSRDEAAEILNTAFLKIFNKIKTYSGEGNFEGWMRRILVNTALDHLKREKKYYEQANVEEFVNITYDNREDNLNANDLLKMIHSLPPMQSAVFNLFAIEGYSHREIGEMMNITEANSKWYLFNARKALQEKVNSTNQ